MSTQETLFEDSSFPEVYHDYSQTSPDDVCGCGFIVPNLPEDFSDANYASVIRGADGAVDPLATLAAIKAYLPHNRDASGEVT